MSNEQLLELADEMAAENDELINYYSDKLLALATPSPQAATLWIQFSDDRKNIRFWTNDPDRALEESFCHGRPLTAFYATPQPQGDGSPDVSVGGECETCGLREPSQTAEYKAALDLLADFNPGADEFSGALEVLRCANLSTPQARPDSGEAIDLSNWAHHYSVNPTAVEALQSILRAHPAPADVSRLVAACEKLGPWMSAALSDDAACEEFKECALEFIEALHTLTTDKQRGSDGESVPDAHVQDDVCPNCVTPWKCNGPHIGEAPDSGYETATPQAANPSACELGAVVAGVRDTLVVAANNPSSHGREIGLRKIMLEQANRIDAALQHRGDSPEAAP